MTCDGLKTLPVENTFILEDWPTGDTYNPNDYATEPCEPVANSRSEMVAHLLTFYDLTEVGTIYWKWYRDRDSKLLFQLTYTIQGTPPWSWYQVYTWLGKFPNEICETGNYHLDITTPWVNITYHFTIIGKCGGNSSEIYVDCTNGSNCNSGMGDFPCAFKTITKAQSVVADNGTIFIKYGDYTNEILSQVLNPIQNNVKLMPVLSKAVEGSGTVYINGN